MTTERGWLLKALNNPGTAVDIAARTGVSASECAHALNVLHDAFVVERVKSESGPRGGRPRWEYSLSESRNG